MSNYALIKYEKFKSMDFCNFECCLNNTDIFSEDIWNKNPRISFYQTDGIALKAICISVFKKNKKENKIFFACKDLPLITVIDGECLIENTSFIESKNQKVARKINRYIVGYIKDNYLKINPESDISQSLAIYLNLL